MDTSTNPSSSPKDFVPRSKLADAYPKEIWMNDQTGNMQIGQNKCISIRIATAA